MIIEPDVQRKCTRIPFDGQVNLEFISNRYERCQIKDISQAGMFVMGDFQQGLNKPCNVSLVPSAMFQDSNLQGQAKIVRKNEEGIAVEFVSMDHESYMLLLTMLLSKTENPTVTNRLMTEECPFEVVDDFAIVSEPSDLFH